MKQQLEQYFNTASSTWVGDEWLKEYRTKALEHFLTQGFPTRHEENWKYTDLSFLEKMPFQYSEAEEISNTRSIGFQGVEDGHRIVFVDGHFSQALSSNNFPEQCTFLSLREAVKSHPGNVQKHLLQSEKNGQARLSHLNTAMMSDGYYISIPKNTVIEKPIHILFIASGNHQVFVRNILELEQNSQVKIFEEHLSLKDDLSRVDKGAPKQSNGGHATLSPPYEGDGNSIAHYLTQIAVAQGASLDLYKLQHQDTQAIHLAQTSIEQSRDSTIHSFNVTLGGKLSRDDLQVGLNAEGASCNLQGLYLGDGEQHIDHHTRIDHFMPHGTSQEYYKGILSGKSRGVFNGKVLVHPDAQKTISQQTNKNLLLSKYAEVDTKPELEIYADDVACAHGATVGQIDPESLFYLQSRGIDKFSAIKLMLNAFADEILSTFKDESISEYLQEVVHKKMDAM